MDVQHKQIQDGVMLTSPDSSTPSSSSPVDLVSQILNDEFDDFEKSNGPGSRRPSDEDNDNYHLPLFKRAAPSFSGLDFLSFRSDSVGGSTPTSGGSSSDLSPPTGRDLSDNLATHLSDPFTNRNLRRPALGDVNHKMSSPDPSLSLLDQFDLFSSYPGSLVTDRSSAPKFNNLSDDRSSVAKYNDLSSFETVPNFNGLMGFETDRNSAPKFNGFGSEARADRSSLSKFNDLTCFDNDQMSVSTFNGLSGGRSSGQQFNGFASETQTEDLDMLNQAISLAVSINPNSSDISIFNYITRFGVQTC
jgi:hypothetical protein